MFRLKQLFLRSNNTAVRTRDVCPEFNSCVKFRYRHWTTREGVLKSSWQALDSDAFVEREFISGHVYPAGVYQDAFQHIVIVWSR